MSVTLDPVSTATVTTGQATPVTLNVPRGGQIEMWYPGTHRYAVSLVGPGCSETVRVEPGASSQSFDTDCGQIEILHTEPQANNDDRQVLVTLGDGSKPLKTGTWTINVLGVTVPGGSATFSMICGEVAGQIEFTSNTTPVTASILTDTSSASRTIGVATYVTKTAFTSAGGPVDNDGSGPIGDVTNFSSRGPVLINPRTGSADVKPEVSGPGVNVFSSYPPATYATLSGTSMATPHVAGAAALLMSAVPALKGHPLTVKQLLTGTATTSGVTDPVDQTCGGTARTDWPNNMVGHGRIDVFAAYQAAVTGTLDLSADAP